MEEALYQSAYSSSLSKVPMIPENLEFCCCQMSPSAMNIRSELKGAQDEVLGASEQWTSYTKARDPYYSGKNDSQNQEKLRKRFRNVDLKTNEGGRIENFDWLKPSIFHSTPVEELRRRLRSDGYLYLRGLLPSKIVTSVREEYFELFRETGILHDSHSAEEGIFKKSNDPLRFTGIGGDVDASQRLWKQKIWMSHTMPKYLEFVRHEKLRQAVRTVMDWREEILLERTMIRSNVPGGLSTGTHYDKLYLRDGSDPFLTAWVPIGELLLIPSLRTELTLS